MAREIERKFLVKDDSWRGQDEGVLIRQGYLSSQKASTVRVRISGQSSFLTVKGKTRHISREEFEYEIPKDDAEAMLNLCQNYIIEKTRYRIEYAGNTWEVDEFRGNNNGLVLAEIELQSENQEFEKPSWIGKEVSFEAKYFNANLAKNPFTSW
jgi:CYTH domain-containing protein